MKKLSAIVICLLSLVLLMPLAVSAAYNTVTFDADTSAYLADIPLTVTIVDGAEVADFIVEGNSIHFNMESGSSVSIISSDSKTMTSSLGTKSTCGTASSSIALSSTITQGISIDFGGTCSGVGNAVINTGGGGGGSTYTPPKTTTTKTTTQTTTMTQAQIKSEIVKLTALILELQTQLLNLAGGGSLSVQVSGDLKQGNEGAQVRLLQEWLSKDTEVYPEGIVSGWFGPLTKAAVIRFQEKYHEDVLAPWKFTKGTGMVGPTTRAKLNALYGN